SSLRLRPPPPSPLFPYTTLFRSAITVNDRLPAPTLRWREGDTVALRVSNRLPPGVQTSIHWHGIVLPANMDGVPGMSFDGIMPGDRKSTRLNSSHVKISYAVFCL